MNLRPFKLYGVCLEPLNSSNVGDFSWSWILKGFVHVQIEKKNLSSYVHVLHKTSHWKVSRRSQTVDVKEMYWKAWYTCRAVVLLIKPTVFWRCRRCSYLSLPILVEEIVVVDHGDWYCLCFMEIGNMFCVIQLQLLFAKYLIMAKQ